MPSPQKRQWLQRLSTETPQVRRTEACMYEMHPVCSGLQIRNTANVAFPGRLGLAKHRQCPNHTAVVGLQRSVRAKGIALVYGEAPT
jgi:hypothetical protein